MMHKAWSSIEELSYSFSRSSVKFEGHTAKKIIDFDPNWAFPDCNSRLNPPMAMKCCTKLETAKERCPFVFQGHPSNHKVTRDKTSPILIQIWRFRTIGRSQLSNPSDLPCLAHIFLVTKFHFLLTTADQRFELRRCSWKFFWSSDNMSDDFAQFIRHCERIIRWFSLSIHKKFFRWSDSLSYDFEQNHQQWLFGHWLFMNTD